MKNEQNSPAVAGQVERRVGRHTPGQLERGQSVVWYMQRRWGGTQAVQAVFLEYRGKCSARIAHGDRERTVRLASVRAVTPNAELRRAADGAEINRDA
jgi:hypothetical protein